MKVTVSFGEVRVIVPCGDGSLLVRELIEKSTTRYKKASGKPLDHWIHVHTLKLSSDGGILDPDDQLIDVADDREQIIAFFEEQSRPSVPHNGGDGTSASSAGTASPDMFQGSHDGDKGFRPMYLNRNHHNDVIITPNDLTLGTNLTVRRGSEPSLNKIGTVEEKPGGNNTLPRNKNKRWSALAHIDDSPGPSTFVRDPVYSDSDASEDRTSSQLSGIGEEAELTSFARDSTRKSLGNMPGMYKWLDAQDRAEDKYHQFHDIRKEPLGGHVNQNNEPSPKKVRGDSFLIKMRNEAGPLGIHVVPHYTEEGRETGLVVQGIEPGGRIHRDGQLRVQDRITEINEASLLDVSFTKAQEIFKGALQTDEIRLRVIKHHENVKPPDKKPSRQPPPTPPKPDMKKVSIALAKTRDKNDNITHSMVPPETLTPPSERPTHLSEVQPSNEMPRVPPPVPDRSAETSLSNTVSERQIVTNTRKIGKKIPIQLAKGPDGLGFSITTRDNPAGGTAPIYVKNVLPKGAAITDGRLKPGDRLLEVSGVDLTDKTQSDAVGLLRNAKLGSIVDILVSRQEVVDRFTVPRQLAPDQGIETDDEQPSRETIRLDIPLNETGSAGLGVSVKGKTQKREGVSIDMGIFVKAVMHGGAASKDGRLRVNDQLINVNGKSLIGKSNADAMETLRHAMQTEGPMPGHIQLVVSRKIGAPTPTPEGGGTFSYEHLGYDNKSPTYTDHNTSLEERTFRTIDTQNLVLEQSMDNERYVSPKSSPRRYNDSVTLNSKMEYSVMVENDNSFNVQRPRPHSTIGFIRPTPPDTPSSCSSHEGERRKCSSQNGDIPLDDSMVLFHREGFGRQSMSEKRRGHIDAKQMEFYQKLKGEKAEREKESDEEKREEVAPPVEQKRDTADVLPPHPWMWRHYTMNIHPPSSSTLPNRTSRSFFTCETGSWDPRKVRMVRGPDTHPEQQMSPREDIGPTLGMKKSSSLESLQAMVKEVEEEEDGSFWHGPSNVVRGRGCNESFRAAVDRSYDVPHAGVETMEAFDEDEENASQERKSATNSARSSMSFEGQPAEITLVQKGKGKQQVKDKEKKPGGLFKGLFKFGQKRKTVEITKSPVHKNKAPELPPRQENPELIRARQVAQEEQEKIQEHYRRLQEKQRQLDQQQTNQGLNRDAASMPQTREERIQQLRSEHQRKHQERHGRYPHEEKEEMYEEEIKDFEDRQQPTYHDMQWHGNSDYSEIPPRWGSQSTSKMEVLDGRPRHAPPSGNSYNNYQRHEDIREALQRHDQYREQYMKYQQGIVMQHQQAIAMQQHMQQVKMEQARQMQIAGKYGAQNGREKMRSVTPVNSMGYMPQYHKKPLMGSLSASHVTGSSGFELDYDDPSNAYQEPQYAVVQRRNKPPGPAKV